MTKLQEHSNNRTRGTPGNNSTKSPWMGGGSEDTNDLMSPNQTYTPNVDFYDGEDSGDESPPSTGLEFPIVSEPLWPYSLP